MKQVIVSAPGRIDLVAGPSDWCGMNTLSMAINLRATATATKLENSKFIQISIGDESVSYETPAYDGKLDLLKAVIELTGLRGFSIELTTDIPRGSGLGGSAPLTVATVMALNKLFEKGWSRYYMTELSQRAETFKLHTVNGYQDQYASMFGGLLFMNFEGKSCQRGDYSKTVEAEPYATVEQLEEYTPDFNLVVAVPTIVRTGSDETNGSLSDRYLRGEDKIVALMLESATNARLAKKALVDDNLDTLYGYIKRENEILREYGFLTNANEEIISTATRMGARASKVCGAGRGAVAIFASSRENQQAIYEALQGSVEHLFTPTIDEGARYES